MPKTEQFTNQIDPHEYNASNSIFRQQRQVIPSMHVTRNLIDSEPPELDAETPTFRSKSINLFLDNENDQNYFNIFDDESGAAAKKNTLNETVDDVEESEKKISSANRPNPVSLFSDDDNFDDSFLPKSSKSISNTIPRRTDTKITNLFEDDDSNDEDDLFLKPAEPVTVRSTILSSAPSTLKKDVFLCNLFDDEPPEDDFDIFKKKSNEPIQVANENIHSQSISNSDDDLHEDSRQSEDVRETIEQSVENIDSNTMPELKSKSIDLFDADESDKFEAKTSESIVSPVKQTKNIYNTIRLFDDTPPDDNDDDIFSNRVSKPKERQENTVPEHAKIVESVQHREFYNDFSETIIIPEDVVDRTSNLQSANELANEEVIESKQIDKKQSEFSKKLGLFANSTKINNSNNNIRVDSAIKSQPKKLNMANIDINVAALLPGAKRSKPIETVEHSSDESKEIVSVSSNEQQEFDSSTKAIYQENVGSDGRLMNLNRNRAKVAIQRRPSTRNGRKQQYKKSLEEQEHDNENADFEDNQINSNIPDEEKFDVISESNTLIDSNPKLVNDTSNSMQINADEKKVEKSMEQIDENVTSESMDETSEHTETKENVESSSNELSFDDESEIEKIKANTTTLNSNAIISSIFDADENENDDFDFLISEKSDETKAITTKVTPVFIDELPPELDPIDNSMFTEKDKKNSSLLSKNASDLFGDIDDDDDEFEEQIFTNQKQNELPTPEIGKLISLNKFT